jgi:hypothetical protein
MAARFRQIVHFDGVDEGVGPLDAAVIVPSGGSSLVFLEGGPDLHVASDAPSQVAVTEVKSFSGGDLMSFLNDLGANVALTAAVLSSGAKRLFRVSGLAPAGKKGVAIRAKNRKRGTLEAQLQAIVLKAKPMKVSLRQIQVFADETRQTTTLLSQGAFDPKAALEHMNMVWQNQANVSWALGRTDPALIDAIDVRSGGPNRDNDAQNKALSASRDQGADLTIFFSRKAFDPNGVRTSTPWNFSKAGFTHARGGFCVIADNPAGFTVEHEEGHFLGALDEAGKFVADYAHSSGHHMMNPDDVPNGIIPARMAIQFNKGFAAKPGP